MRRHDGGTPAPDVASQQVATVLEATRVVGALIAESLADLEPSVTVPQWRVLVLASDGSSNLSAVADDLGVHRSNATRICDRLVRAGLLSRVRDSVDRRQVRLALTPSGRRFLDAAMRHRHESVERALARISAEHRAVLTEALSEFADALGAVHQERLGHDA